MKVADLQQHLTDLGKLLEASGAKGVGVELAAVGNGLAPYRELTLKGFADFLVRADPARDGGATAPGQRATRGTALKVQPDVNALAQEAHELHERAAAPTTTEEEIAALMTRLGGLKKDGLVLVGEKIGLKGMKAKAKSGILDAIEERIKSRRGATLRAELIDRPEPTTAQPTPAPSG